MGKSRAQLIAKVLSNLGLGNDTPAADDTAKVDRVVDDVCASLRMRRVYTVADPGTTGPSGGDIQPEEFQQLAAIITSAVAQEFDDADTRYLAPATQAEEELKVIASPSRTQRLLRVDPAVLPARRGFYGGLS
jgi:hypothetical protein